MLKRKIPYLLIVLIGFLAAKCGQRGSPSGGPEDVTPPAVKQSSPLNNTTGFSGKEVSFEFDEYVKVTGFYNEFVISPPVATPPKYKLKGKRLILTFEEDFAENTTYNILLGSAIKDITKGNVLTQNQLVFSTGSFVDSLSFSGNVYDAKTMVAETGGMVHLYRNTSDSVPCKEIPAYFAQIKNGKFSFKNLAAGDYKIFALSDINSNYIYDLPNEKIAFQPDLIHVDENVDSSTVNLMTFVAENNNQFVVDYSSHLKGEVKIKFNNPVEQLSIELIGHQFKKEWKVLKWNEIQDSLTLWSTELVDLDSFALGLNYDGELDTLLFKSKHGPSVQESKFEIHHNKESFANSIFDSLELTFNKPLRSYDAKQFVWISNQDTSSVDVSQKGALTELKIHKKLGVKKDYKLIIPPGAVQSVFGDSNEDSLFIRFTTAEEGALSNLVFEYDFSALSSKGVLEFWAGKEKKSTFYIDKLKGVLTIPGMLPSKYKFKFIADVDGNKRWSAGDYWQNQQPEKVYWYKEEINVRANWEMEVKWVLIP